jgi:pimeloyl-ACP methyl ester carboxylesterase
MRVNGVRLFYEEMGSGPETIIFSHSFLLSGVHFNPQMQGLRDRYRCIAFDHRGHGRSERTADGYDMENLYQDAVAFIEGMECAPCHFVGLSTGGFIGMRIGIRRPDLLTSLVLMDTSPDGEPPEALGRYKLLTLVIRLLGWRPVIGRLLSLFFGRKFLNDPARRDALKEWRGCIMSNDRTAARKFAQGILTREGVYDDLSKITTPTLVIAGEEDIPTPVSKARRIAEQIPGARLEIIADAGHICTVEEPRAVTGAIASFLQSIIHKT